MTKERLRSRKIAKKRSGRPHKKQVSFYKEQKELGDQPDDSET
jgi:hypothetical protein